MSAAAVAKLQIPREDVISVADLAVRLGDEVADAACLAADCQDAVSEALDGPVADHLAQRLQRLDELTQRLEDLADMIRRLAAGADLGDAPADVLDGLKLSDLKTRLAGGQLEAVASGEPDLW